MEPQTSDLDMITRFQDKCLASNIEHPTSTQIDISRLQVCPRSCWFRPTTNVLPCFLFPPVNTEDKWEIFQSGSVRVCRGGGYWWWGILVVVVGNAMSGYLFTARDKKTWSPPPPPPLQPPHSAVSGARLRLTLAPCPPLEPEWPTSHHHRDINTNIFLSSNIFIIELFSCKALAKAQVVKGNGDGDLVIISYVIVILICVVRQVIIYLPCLLLLLSTSLLSPCLLVCLPACVDNRYLQRWS